MAKPDFSISGAGACLFVTALLVLILGILFVYTVFWA